MDSLHEDTDPFMCELQAQITITYWSKKFWRQQLQRKIKNKFYQQYTIVTVVGF
jgi:hypothetical protein